MKMDDAIAVKEPTPGAGHNTGKDNSKPALSGIKAAIRSELDIGDKEAESDDEIKPSEYEGAGYNYVYRKCSNYFDALIKLQNENGYGGDLVTAGGSAVGTLLGLASASASAISGVAAGTGFVSSVVSSYNNRALLTPYPNETKSLILGELDDYRKKVDPKNVTTPQDAINNVQHFAELCTYSGITRAAKQAIANFKPNVDVKGSSTTEALATSITKDLGLSSDLNNKELVELYVYLLKNVTSPWKDTADGPAIRADMPPDLQAMLLSSDKKTAIDPHVVRDKVKADLDKAYGDDLQFKTAVDIYSKPPNSQPAAGAPAKIAAGKVVHKPHKAKKPSPKVVIPYKADEKNEEQLVAPIAAPNTSNVTSEKPFQITKPSSDSFGHLDLSPPPPPPSPD